MICVRQSLVAFALALAMPAPAQQPQRTCLNQSHRSLLDPVAGLWRMMPDGAILRIEPLPGVGQYAIRVIDSPDFAVPAGALMGTMTATAAPLVFDAEVSEHPGNPDAPSRRLMLSIDADSGALSLLPYSPGGRLSFRRWLPYLFRLSVTDSNRPEGYDGAVRLGISSGQPVAL